MMMATQCMSWLLVTTILAVSANQIALGGDPNEELKKLEGIWSAVGFFRGSDNVLASDKLKGIGLVVRGDKWYHGRLDRKHEFQKATVRPSKNPKELDLEDVQSNNHRTVILAIYQVQDDCLKIAYNPGSSQRPNSFAPESRPCIWVFKRQR